MNETIFNYAYAACVGTGHKAMGSPCQDKVAICRRENVICAALADGAGSKELSHIAAETVTNQFSTVIADHFKALYQSGDTQIKDFLIEQCTLTKGETETDLDCTFLAAAINSEGKSLTIHVGDGFIIAADCEEGRRIISEPENGEERNQTWFLSSEDLYSHVRIRKDDISTGESIILCSDGSGNALVDMLQMKPAKAVNTISRWIHEYDGETVSEQLGRDLDEVIRAKTKDDMSIAAITLLAE